MHRLNPFNTERQVDAFCKPLFDIIQGHFENAQYVIAGAWRLVEHPSYAFVVVGLQEYCDRSGRLLIMFDWHHLPEQLNMSRERVFFGQPHSFFTDLSKERSARAAWAPTSIVTKLTIHIKDYSSFQNTPRIAGKPITKAVKNLTPEGLT